MPDDHPLITELSKVQYDLTAIKARVSEIQRQVAALNLVPVDTYTCQTCGLHRPSRTSLAEHVRLSHDGPIPEHWLEAERRAGIMAVRGGGTVTG